MCYGGTDIFYIVYGGTDKFLYCARPNLEHFYIEAIYTSLNCTWKSLVRFTLTTLHRVRVLFDSLKV